MSESSREELTTTDVQNFVDFMKFIANNDLWDDAAAAIAGAGVETITVSSRPIRIVRAMIDDELLPGDRLSAGSRRHAAVISECGCGVTTPGPPGHGPEFPHGGPGDAGTNATTETADGSG